MVMVFSMMAIPGANPCPGCQTKNCDDGCPNNSNPTPREEEKDDTNF